jgi:hypothetical protein
VDNTETTIKAVYISHNDLLAIILRNWSEAFIYHMAARLLRIEDRRVTAFIPLLFWLDLGVDQCVLTVATLLDGQNQSKSANV